VTVDELFAVGSAAHAGWAPVVDSPAWLNLRLVIAVGVVDTKDGVRLLAYTQGPFPGSEGDQYVLDIDLVDDEQMQAVRSRLLSATR
jgi:hypothetical protein